MAKSGGSAASVKDVAKVMRGIMPSGPSRAHLAEVDIEKFVGHHKEVMGDLLKVIPKPVKLQLKSAAAMAWEGADVQETELFATRMMTAFSHCRLKAKQSTSGKKLHPAVAYVVSCIRESKKEGGQEVKAIEWKAKGKEEVVEVSGLSSSPSSSSFLSSPSSLARMDTLREMYGLPQKKAKVGDMFEIISSQETIPDSQEGKEIKKAPKPPCSVPSKRSLEWFCSKSKCMVRIKADGTEEKSSMAPGPDGFAISTFPNEEPVVTEMPNLLLTIHLKKTTHPKKTIAPKEVIKKKPAVEETKGALSFPEEGDKAKEVGVGDAEEAGGEGEEKKCTKKILYSRTYHRERCKAKREGCNELDAKSRAQELARKAVLEAQAAGQLLD